MPLPVPRLAVITNPRARQNRRDPSLAPQLAEILGGLGELHQPADHAALAALASRLRDEGVEIVAIHGGDGTSHTVLGALVRAWGDAPLPAIAFLPGGTMNTVAKGVGVRGRGPDVLRRLVRALQAGAPIPEVERTLLRVSGGEADQHGFLFGNGLISNYLEAYYEGAEPTPVKALVVLARGILSSFVNGAFFRRLMRPVEVGVTVDGQSWGRKPYYAVGIGTVDDIGFGFRPFFRAPRNAGMLHALGIACPPLSFVFQLPRIRLALPTRHPAIADGLAREVRIRGDGPQAFMVDGDFHTGGTELVVRAGPRVRLLVPPT